MTPENTSFLFSIIFVTLFVDIQIAVSALPFFQYMYICIKTQIKTLYNIMFLN